MKTSIILIVGLCLSFLLACARVDNVVQARGQTRVEVLEFLTGIASKEVATYVGEEGRSLRRIIAFAEVGDFPEGSSPSRKIKYVIIIFNDGNETNRIYCFEDGRPVLARGEKNDVDKLHMKCRDFIEAYER